jgi:hypothetical protein
MSFHIKTKIWEFWILNKLWRIELPILNRARTRAIGSSALSLQKTHKRKTWAEERSSDAVMGGEPRSAFAVNEPTKKGAPCAGARSAAKTH